MGVHEIEVVVLNGDFEIADAIFAAVVERTDMDSVDSRVLYQRASCRRDKALPHSVVGNDSRNRWLPFSRCDLDG